MIEENGGGFKGKHHSEESKNAMREKLKGRQFSEEHRLKQSMNNARKQKVVMLDKDTFNYIDEFDSMALACNWLKENTIYKKAKSGEISSVCSNKKRSAYGYRWMYYDEYMNNNYTIETCHGNSKKVICLNNNKLFNSIELASEYAKINHTGISACCLGRQITSGKHPITKEPLKWVYYEDYVELNKNKDLKVAN